MRRVLLSSLAVGSCFTFEPSGPVYVRCRGGYRPGRGGPFVRHDPAQRVYRFSLEVQC